MSHALQHVQHTPYDLNTSRIPSTPPLQCLEHPTHPSDVTHVIHHLQHILIPSSCSSIQSTNSTTVSTPLACPSPTLDYNCSAVPAYRPSTANTPYSACRIPSSTSNIQSTT